MRVAATLRDRCSAPIATSSDNASQSTRGHHQYVAGVELVEQSAELRLVDLSCARHFAEHLLRLCHGNVNEHALRAKTRQVVMPLRQHCATVRQPRLGRSEAWNARRDGVAG